ncbi:9171_t:CDS:2, partial [Dentiscutata erythropus]
MLIALKFARLTRRRVLTWTRGYSRNNVVGYTNKSSKLSDKIANKFLLLQTDVLQNTMISLLEKKDKEFLSFVERKDKEFLSLMESNKKELLSLTESNKKELLSLKESNEEKLLSLKESNEEKLLSLKESNEEKLLSLTENKNQELNKANNLAENRAQSLLQTKHMVNVRGALEFVRAQILSKDKSIVFTEPVDNALKRLSQDEDFIKILKKACEDNDLRYDDVQHCIRGLYHSASKHFHGHEPQIVIDSRTWSSNEVFVLGIIFHHFKIPFDYCNGD